MKEVAIIGPTGSGKSALAIEIAQETRAYILSLDSLAIYKKIDIVSAKPSKEELAKVRHFGIDEIDVDDYFSVERFFDIYKRAKEECQKVGRPLLIVGGSGFYLKALHEGLSPMPSFSERTHQKVDEILTDVKRAYEMLKKIDPTFASKITSKDRYRIKKALCLYFETKLPPTRYFALHPPKPLTKSKIYEIAVPRDILRKKITQRTEQMIQKGLVDEICELESEYGRAPAPMKAIGIKETLEYLDGKIKNLEELASKISLHTGHLAKRQQIFNKTQFPQRISKTASELKEEIKRELAD